MGPWRRCAWEVPPAGGGGTGHTSIGTARRAAAKAENVLGLRAIRNHKFGEFACPRITGQLPFNFSISRPQFDLRTGLPDLKAADNVPEPDFAAGDFIWLLGRLQHRSDATDCHDG
jgi:hypothetical protein